MEEDLESTIRRIVQEQMAWDEETRSAVEDLEEILALATEAKTLVDNVYAECPEPELLRVSKCLEQLFYYHRAIRTTMLPGGAVYEQLKTSPKEGTS